VFPGEGGFVRGKKKGTPGKRPGPSGTPLGGEKKRKGGNSRKEVYSYYCEMDVQKEGDHSPAKRKGFWREKKREVSTKKGRRAIPHPGRKTGNMRNGKFALTSSKGFPLKRLSEREREKSQVSFLPRGGRKKGPSRTGCGIEKGRHSGGGGGKILASPFEHPGQRKEEKGGKEIFIFLGDGTGGRDWTLRKKRKKRGLPIPVTLVKREKGLVVLLATGKKGNGKRRLRIPSAKKKKEEEKNVVSTHDSARQGHGRKKRQRKGKRANFLRGERKDFTTTGKEGEKNAQKGKGKSLTWYSLSRKGKKSNQ